MLLDVLKIADFFVSKCLPLLVYVLKFITTHMTYLEESRRRRFINKTNKNLHKKIYRNCYIF